MSVAPTGDGYWLVAADGGVFTFGNAPFQGAATGAGSPAVAMPTACGFYRVLRADGSHNSHGGPCTIDVPMRDQPGPQPFVASAIRATYSN